MDRSPLASFCPSFRSAPAADQCFLSDTGRRMLDAILAGLNAGQPVMVLIGDPGTGKTVMARQVEARSLPDRRVGRIGHGAAQLLDPASHVPGALGLAPDPSFADPQNGPQAVRAACHASGSRFLLIVDEAQALSDKGLDWLAGLTDAPNPQDGILTVLLVGGVDLANRLAQPRHEALRARIGGRFRTTPMDAEETAGYVAHRFRVPGCACHAGIRVFDTAACACLHALSGGVPRVINHLVQSCLFEAGVTGRKSMDAPFVQSCLSAMALDGRLGHLVSPAALRRGAAAIQAGSPAPVGPEHPTSIRSKIFAATPETAPCPVPRTHPPVRTDAANGPAFPGGWRKGLAAAVTGLLVLVPQGLRQPPFDTTSAASLLPFAVSPAVPASTAPPQVPAAGVPVVAAAPSPLSSGIPVEAPPDPSILLARALTVGAVDPDRAAELYAGAALRGNGRAAYYLGQLYETGFGVEPDLLRARAWYETAAGIDGATLRLAQLGPAKMSGDLGTPVAAPVPVSHRLYGSGQTELLWATGAGESVARFRVQLILAGDARTVQHQDTALSAMLVHRPVMRWRIVALHADGTAGQASPWSHIAPPGR